MIAFCKDKQRRDLILQTPGINGLDYLEVLGPPGCGDQLALTFIKDVRGLALSPANISLTGDTTLQVQAVKSATKEEPRTIRVQLRGTGDFSPYTLTLVTSPTNTDPPAGVDSQLNTATFSFKAGCPSPLTDLRGNYNYGAPAEIGGGPYDRTPNIALPGTQSNAEFVNSAAPFKAIVGMAVVGWAEYSTLASAVAAWNRLPTNSAGTILLPNFECYAVDLTGPNAIQIPAQSVLLIASAALAKDGVPEWSEACVTLRGDIEVVAPPVTLDPDGVPLPTGQVRINGVWLSGQLILQGGAACVEVTDSTLIPGIALDTLGEAARPGTPSVMGIVLNTLGDAVYTEARSITGSGSAPPSLTGPLSAPEMTLCLNRVVSGPIAMPSTCSSRICNSIVDSGGPYSVAFAGADLASPGASLHIEESTVIGRVWAHAIRFASNTIFWAKLGQSDPWQAPVWANRAQLGCARFCWLPANSIAPRQYNCLPPDAASQAALEPRFVTLRFGHPGYCLLSGDVAMALWKGADSGSQIGVYYQIQETEAVTNLLIRSAEYLPANLERGVFLIPSRTLPEQASPFQYYRHGREGDLPMGIGVSLI
jgi:hypothetical protein